MRRISMTLGLAAFLVACGGDDPSSKGNNNNNDPNNMTQDMMPGLTPPHAVTVAIDPTRALYITGQTLTPSASVLDADGEVMGDVQVSWTISPEGATTLEEGAYKIAAEGPLTFRACADRPGADGEDVCGEAVVMVDNGPPVITLESPTPGAEMDGSMSSDITIKGTITDTHGTPRATLNGEALSLDASGAFEVTRPASFGVNHFDVTATDGFATSPRHLGFDVLWAPSFHPNDALDQDNPASSVTLGNGIVLNLGQNFFDDGTQAATTPEGAIFTEDLTDILVLILNHLDLKSLLGDGMSMGSSTPVIDNPELKLFVDDLDLGTPNVEINITDDGLELYLQTSDLTVRTSGGLSLLEEQLDLGGKITVGASILAKIVLQKPGADQPFEATVDSIEVALERAESQFLDARADAVFTLAASALRTQVELLLVNTLRDSIVDTLPSLLTDALSSLEDALANQSFELDVKSLGVDPVDVTFSGGIDTLLNTPLTDIEGQVRTQLSIVKAPVYESRGVAVQTGEAAVPPFFESSRLQIGVRLALLNSLLQGVWRIGLLDIDATTLLPDGLDKLVTEAKLIAKLPPVLEPPKKGQPNKLFLRLGQAEFEATFPKQVVRYGISIGAGVDVEVKDNALSVTVAQTPEIDVWIIESEGRPRMSAHQLKSLLSGVLWPELTSALGEGLSLPLPVLDLSDLGRFAQELSTFKLVFDQVREPVITQDFLIIDSVLRGTYIPAP